MTESLYLQYYMPSTAAYTLTVCSATIDGLWQPLTGIYCLVTNIFPAVLCLNTVDIINVYQTDCLTDKLVSYHCTLCSRERREIFYLSFYPISLVKMFQSLWFLAEISSVIIYTAFKCIFSGGSRHGLGRLSPHNAAHPASPNAQKVLLFYTRLAYFYTASPTRPSSGSTIICE